jgi:hypothetical protein
MPVKVTLEKGKYSFITPTTDWKISKCKIKPTDKFKVDNNFYIQAKKVVQ